MTLDLALIQIVDRKSRNDLFLSMLTGTDLLAKVKELGDVSKTDLATECGYVSKKKDGSDRVNFTFSIFCISCFLTA